MFGPAAYMFRKQMAEEDAELLSCCEASHICKKKRNHAQTCSVLISIAVMGRKNRHSFFLSV